MKLNRGLSGCYFRFQNSETKKWENWCFEDLPEEKQDEYMNDRNEEWIRGLVKILANTINEIADQFDIISPAKS